VKRYENILSDDLKSLRFLRELKLLRQIKHPCLCLPVKIFPPSEELSEVSEAYVAFNKAELDLE